jgi:hypothetical protein
VGWLGYLKSHTVKDLVRLGILSDEFKRRFVIGKSNAILASALYDVLLARAGDAGGLDYWGKQYGLFGWEKVVDLILASTEYKKRFGNDAVPGGGRAPCAPPPSKQEPSKMLVEQFYCRVLQRSPESDQAIVGWLDYLKSHTIKDLVRLGILGDEFKIRFVNGQSDETLARILFDVLLARAGNPRGLHAWAAHIGIHGWDSAVNSILASGEYNNRFGDDAVPGGGRAECGSHLLVEQFYCRVLQRPPESDQTIVGWLDYLKSHTIKDLVRLGILGDEFKIRFVNGKSDETLAGTLYDVLLARAGDAGGLALWEEQVGELGWEYVVDQFLASPEYNDRFGDDAVPGGGRALCGPQTPSQSPSKDPSTMPSKEPSKEPLTPPPTPGTVTYVPGEATVFENGLLLSTGLTSRIIATKHETVQYDTGGRSGAHFHTAPDGKTDDSSLPCLLLIANSCRQKPWTHFCFCNLL